MTIAEKTFAAVAKATGVTTEQMQSKSRVFSHHEARMLFVALMQWQDMPSNIIAWSLKRSPSMTLSLGHSAQAYLAVNGAFTDKYNKIIKQL